MCEEDPRKVKKKSDRSRIKESKTLKARELTERACSPALFLVRATTLRWYVGKDVNGGGTELCEYIERFTF